MNLLLVEDNSGDVALVSAALEEISIPIRLSVVHYGITVLTFLRRQKPYADAPQPDLIILDLNLPTKNGREILAELKQDPKLRFIPVVVLTTSDNQRDINQCYKLGANAYLVKPLQLEQFFRLVKVTIEFWSACKFPQTGQQLSVPIRKV